VESEVSRVQLTHYPRSQHDDPLRESLLTLCVLHQKPASRAMLTTGLPLPAQRLSPDLLPRAAARAGLQGRLLQRKLEQIPSIAMPAMLLLNEELGLAWNALENANAQVPIAQQYVDHGNRVRSAYQQQLGLGERTLLDSENETFTAQRRLVEVKNIQMFTQYRIKATIGQLLKSQGVVAPLAPLCRTT